MHENSLAHDLKKQIKSTGPISVAAYWAQCLFDPKAGYYSSQNPFGSDGDFTTAPEISQMFGELLAAWWLTAVRQNGLETCALVEVGPGRGTLMADMLCTLQKLEPDASRMFPVHMVESSPRLTAIQKTLLNASGFSITWHSSIETMPRQPFGLITNELLDAIPIRQFVKTGAGWQERCVDLDDNDQFCFVPWDVSLDTAFLPKDHRDKAVGTIFEKAPAREAMMADIAQRLEEVGGFGLFIDYGHSKSDFGDTLQALKKHKFISVLEEQGFADISSHVDFQALANVASDHGLQDYDVITQGDFLGRLGIHERTKQLVTLRPDQEKTLVTACERLTSNEQMGSLFKVLGISSQDIALPALQKSS